MNIFKKIWQKLKNIFTKKEEIVMLEVSKEDSKQERNVFKQSLKIKKKVQSHICHGDGLGIKKKLEN